MSPPRVGESPVHRQYNPSLASINELYQTGTQRQYYGYNDYCDSGSVYSESMSMHSHSSARPLLPERFRPVAVTVAPPSANVQSQSHVVEDDAASVYSSGTSGPFRIRTDSGYRVSSALPPIWFPEEEDESQPKHNSGSDTLNSGNSDDRDRWTRTTLSPPISPYSPFASIAEKRSSSIYAFNPPQDDKGSQNLKPIDTTPPESVKPSMLSLLTLIPLRDAAKSLLPAVILSTATGLVTPYMALMVGNAFSALAAFPTDPKLATDALKAKLLKDVGHTSMLFAIAGLLGVIGSYFATIFWVRYSESSTAALRWMVFMGVEGKPMYWFDTGMGLQEDANKVGAGGLMTKFTRYVGQ
jgi:hypothetical protein